VRPGRSPFLLAHLSDPHLPLPPGTALRDVLNKRALSLLSWHMKRHPHHRRETLDRLTADLADQAADHIAVTGDLTNLGLDAEYARARDWLLGLGDPAHVSVIPGNHEALVRGAWEAGAPRWQPWWQGDGATGGDVANAFPYLRQRGPLALIGVSSAEPSPPGRATGRVGSAQLARLAALLAQARADGRCRVVMIHHPPLDGTVIARKRLLDAADLRSVLAREGVEMVLHGHSHRSHLEELQTPAGAALVIGVPSASSMYREPASCNLYRIAPGDGGWHLALTTRQLTPQERVETAQSLTVHLPRDHAGG